MELEVMDVLKQYEEAVEKVCHILIEGINEQNKRMLFTKKDFFLYREENKKMEFEIKGISYRLHGIGCTAFNDTFYLNWDFGYRSRWCGIDPWKVAITLKKNNYEHEEYYDGKWIHAICENYVEKGMMKKKNQLFYFSNDTYECFLPNYPKEYDKLIIEGRDCYIEIDKNKKLDKFARKSIAVCQKIYQNENRFLLRFVLNNEEIYSIPYDDVNYPESAIKIMSDEIIRR